MPDDPLGFLAEYEPEGYVDLPPEAAPDPAAPVVPKGERFIVGQLPSIHDPDFIGPIPDPSPATAADPYAEMAARLLGGAPEPFQPQAHVAPPALDATINLPAPGAPATSAPTGLDGKIDGLEDFEPPVLLSEGFVPAAPTGPPITQVVKDENADSTMPTVNQPSRIPKRVEGEAQTIIDSEGPAAHSPTVDVPAPKGTQKPEPRQPSPAELLQGGETIGNYLIIDANGPKEEDGKRRKPHAYVKRGGMGVVYLAKHKTLERPAALKFLMNEQKDPDLEQKFLGEARAMCEVSHPNICHVHDVIEWNGLKVIAMEYLPGGDLEKLLEKQEGHAVKTDSSRRTSRFVPAMARAIVIPEDDSPKQYLRGGDELTERDTAKLGMILAQAFSEAHKSGLVHRDIKPENIMFKDEYHKHPMVVDFGLALLVQQELTEEERKNIRGALIGTPQYMAPEQAMGDNERINATTDVYQLGALMYRILAGHLPYQHAEKAKDLVELLKRVIEAPLKPAHVVNPGVDKGLSMIISKMMSKEQKDRYQSMDDVSKALEEWLEGGPTYRWMKRNPGKFATVIATGVLGIAATVYGLFQWGETRRIRREAMDVAAVARGQYDGLSADLARVHSANVAPIEAAIAQAGSASSEVDAWVRRARSAESADARAQLEGVRRNLDALLTREQNMKRAEELMPRYRAAVQDYRFAEAAEHVQLAFEYAPSVVAVEASLQLGVPRPESAEALRELARRFVVDAETKRDETSGERTEQAFRAVQKYGARVRLIYRDTVLRRMTETERDRRLTEERASLDQVLDVPEQDYLRNTPLTRRAVCLQEADHLRTEAHTEADALGNREDVALSTRMRVREEWHLREVGRLRRAYFDSKLQGDDDAVYLDTLRRLGELRYQHFDDNADRDNSAYQDEAKTLVDGVIERD